ncbi:MAG TPA: CehA/McbA family metallohydrolase [Terriglobia bacterium]|jgi:hypothetical protein|nr:CehA/McbA family metallohydrolase [Terriglobia bacterium]
MPSIVTSCPKTLAAAVLLVMAAHSSQALPGGPQSSVPLQPFADEVRQLESVLSFLGQPLTSADQEAINARFADPDPDKAIAGVESVLDKYTLAVVNINAESRVSVQRGSAPPDLIEDGTRIFLVKVVNLAGVTARLAVESPNSGNVFIPSRNSPEPPMKLTAADVAERWADISLYNKPPLEERLSGFALEYRILTFFSRDAGQRSAKLSFNVGQGTADVGFQNEITVLCNVAPARTISLGVLDEDGQPTMASFVFRDSLDRIYPNPAKRLAPDFFFQPQVYRANGESIALPKGSYNVTVTGGPEYIAENRQFEVGPDGPAGLSFQLKRWIDPAKYGWYSGDHHIHAAGCSHYENPSEGVTPQDMDRQVRGEHLNVGCVLTWGPCYYYQKQFFRGRQDDPASKRNHLLHYDLEVSGFPSSHTGHLVLLNLADQDYPGTKRIEDWPTWDLPILRWGKAQGATVGFAHSGWGLELQGDALPNYNIPGFDGIGANEYIVDATYPDTVDFISAGDTPYAWELNIWYQTLNVGFRTRISGETDFPCIYDSRVGEGRTYARITPPLTYADWNAAIRGGATYVSDGRSHLMDLRVNDVAPGEHGSEVRLSAPGRVHVKLSAAAYLDPEPDPKMAARPYDQKPYWSLERARIAGTRKVPVEIVVNGTAIARQELEADGTPRNLEFDVPVDQSSWVAARILPSSHTNPIFVLIGDRPIRASRRSAQWCLASVNQCWTQKAPKMSAADMPEARKAYDHAREVYQKLIEECKVE